jgi:hypothetical protein
MEPLPPIKEVEYRCIVGKMIDDMTGLEYSTFSFETSKEFSSFRYEIAVRYKVEPGNLVFRVLGMTATRMMMPAFGTAKSLLKVPTLPLGKYTVTILKSDGSENVFYIEHTRKGFQILKPIPRKRFIDVVISKEAAMPGGKILSTVSKAPPPPLVPRTIQKRAPAPPTPEELEILEALKTETPEERDAREEAELFGSSSRKKSATNGKADTKKKAAKPAAKAKNGKTAAKAKPAAKNHKKAAAKPAKKAKPAAKKKKH